MSWLERALNLREPFVLGEVTIRPEGDSFVVQGPAGSRAITRIEGAAALRDRLRTDRLGRYRPLSGARSMPGGWEIWCANEAELRDGLDVIYPLAVRHIEQAATSTLRTTALDAVLGRQTGRYEAADRLLVAGREIAVEVVCAACVRTPAWEGILPNEGGTIPCPEACSVLVGFCREAALWEADPPAPQPISDAVGFAAFDDPGNELRETYLRRRFGGHQPAEEPNP
ncbi:MAG: hypothetical protein HY875_04775 [Chloroflexi bacterium]|nr:hypothetical protein [Chloroflexota bacterium]